ncbi:hypothetical protein CY34DRAFT_812925 [Suillus luteus UH-Slu-Lm8-n1]|uniref:Uncharacterized protein n=1 Tax=Suillus luteus UH-Slu-Lm8-n1 TaxID=930992 RepID=A0A0C9ZYB3_9AGAM|nr:hypothetical protein CY34DRAFT_812925 [Suillus luteus UH-Slu-Lm8-n1]
MIHISWYYATQLVKVTYSIRSTPRPTHAFGGHAVLSRAKPPLYKPEAATSEVESQRLSTVAAPVAAQTNNYDANEGSR